MSGDQQASSFGDPSALPPTPKRTPASRVLASPVFETPKNQQGPFNESGNWTPLFSEEFSVFNTTPGNLQASHDPLVDLTSPERTAFRVSGVNTRQPSTGGITAAAAHDTHFDSNSDVSTQLAVPSRVLPSSPGPVNGTQELSGDKDDRSESQVNTPRASGRVNKPKQGRPGVRPEDEKEKVEEAQGQTATPPPSTHKGGRNSKPRLEVGNMQSDHGFGQPDFGAETSQQPNMASFGSTSDFFSYPMSAPAVTAPSSSFWDPGADMSGMDMDFSFGVDAFQTLAPGHRPAVSFDANQMFQDMDALSQEPPPPQPSQAPRQRHQQATKEKARSVRRPRPLAPKTTQSQTETQQTSTTGPSLSSTAAHSGAVDDPFGLVSPGTGGVDPGLLFSRPQSSSMDLSLPTTATQSDWGPPEFSMESVAQALSKAPMRNEVRRSSSTRERPANRVPDRGLASSPVKSGSRPGLQRSLSENRGKRSLARNPPLSLAPAAQPAPMPTQTLNVASSSRVVGSRPPNARSSGRTSPLKKQYHLSSLTSIPEAPPPRTRTVVKFTIDADGRARAETTVVVDGETSGPGSEASVPRSSRRSSRSASGREQSYDSGDEESTDDEPIIIPSRTTSFALPDPHKPTRSGFHTSRRSFNDRSSRVSFMAGSGIDGGAGHDTESDAETVMNELQHGGSDDAASELRRLMESRPKRRSVTGIAGLSARIQQQRERSQGWMGRSFGGMAGPAVASSPTMTDRSLSTPSTETRERRIRCVCQRHGGSRDGDGFMVQCESCEMWLHGQCIRITSRRMLPSVYICAFCANTNPMRDGGRDTAHGGGASPLAHKSFKSFR